jgi:hypothetical protein
MSFVARCPYCKLIILNIPDERLGISLECRRCHNSFTLAPTADATAATTSGRAEPSSAVAAERVVRLPPAPVAKKPKPPAADERLEPDEPVMPTTPLLQDIPDADIPAEDVPEELPEPSVRRPPSYAGLASFLLGSFAFLTAAVLHVSLLTLALGLLGLLLGVVGFLSSGQRRRFLPTAGLLVSLPAVLVTVFLPAWLGLGPLWDPPKPPDRAGDAILALNGRGGLRRAAEGEVRWADASRDALYHGDVRLRVTSAVVGPLDFEAQPGREAPGERCLAVGLRVTNAGITRKLSYTAGWGVVAPGQDRPVLRDDRGNAYAEKSFPAGLVVKGRAAASAVPPGKWLDDVLVFEAPPEAVGYLRLELPAAAVGSTGSLRLEIPRRMIHFR